MRHISVQQNEQAIVIETPKIRFSYDLAAAAYSVRFPESGGEATQNIGFSFARGDQQVHSKQMAGITATTRLQEAESCFGPHLCLKVERPWGDLTVCQIFRLFPDKNYLLLSLELTGSDFVYTNYMSPLYVSGGKVCDIPQAKDYRYLNAPYDNDMWERFHARKPEECSGSFEVAAAFDAGTQRGYVVGSVTHDHWKTAIDTHGGYEGLSEMIFYGGAACSGTRDIEPHGMVRGCTVESPIAMLGYYEDFRRGLIEFGKVNTQYQPALSWAEGVPFGWNSWACVAGKLNFDSYDTASRNLKELEKQGFLEDGTAYVNFDACWHNLSQQELKQAVENVHSRGQKAGIYGTPFACWNPNFDLPVEGSGGLYTYRDIVARDHRGQILPPVDSGYSLDPSHPGTLLRMEHLAKTIADLGFDYLKVDFMSHGARECSHYLGSITTGTEAYCYGLKHLCRLLSPEKLGRSVFIDFSIAPIFPHGYCHARRVSCDAFGQIYDTEYLLNSTTYGFWQNDTICRFNDPDHTVLYQSFGRPITTEAEAGSRLHASVISGTVMLLSDDYRIPQAAERTKSLLTPELLDIARKGTTFLPVETNAGSGASRSFFRDDGDCLYLAVFNYSTAESLDYKLPVERIAPLPQDSIFHSLDGSQSFSGPILNIPLKPSQSMILRCRKA